MQELANMLHSTCVEETGASESKFIHMLLILFMKLSAIYPTFQLAFVPIITLQCKLHCNAFINDKN